MRVVIALAALSGLSLCCAGEEMPEEVFRRVSKDKTRWVANAKGAKAKECLRVVDQDGAPVEGAKIWGGLQTGSGYNDFIPIRGTTDTNGEYVIQGKCTSRIRCDITKDGYYRSEFLMTDYGHKHSVKDGKWQPYGKETVVVLRRIRHLGSLAVPVGEDGLVGRWRIPVWNRWIGFDLERFDWLSPYGRGVSNDVQLRFGSEIKDQYFDFKFSMEVSFTNNPCAGAYICKKSKGSDLEWPEHADTNGVFVSEYRFSHESRLDGAKVVNTLTDDSVLVFRTRTRVDEDGKLLSAHYGVISGRWSLGSETMRIDDACFNKNENDPCIEDGWYLRKKVRETKY